MNSFSSNGQPSTPALTTIRENGPQYREGTSNMALEPVAGIGAEPGTVPDAAKANVTSESRNRRRSSETRMRKLSSQQIHHLTTSPDSLPLRALESEDETPCIVPFGRGSVDRTGRTSATEAKYDQPHSLPKDTDALHDEPHDVFVDDSSSASISMRDNRPGAPLRVQSSPVFQRKLSASRSSKPRSPFFPAKIEEAATERPTDTIKISSRYDRSPSPMPATIPLPPLSLSTYLHLELSSARPSPLYMHRSATADFPYESSKVKFQRLLNFLMLPPNLEQVLWFGAIACLDAWLYTFTILPLRFLKALAIFSKWLLRNASQEAVDLATYVYGGLGRIWERHRSNSSFQVRGRSASKVRRSQMVSGERVAKSTASGHAKAPPPLDRSRMSSDFRHRRTRSTPSALLPNHKADLLQGLLIISSCSMLMWLDASRMYHSIRGQAAIKLYVIYNVLEVFDRLFSAIGQDVLECLFSKETLERNSEGRSKVFRPLWMFFLALAYNIIHATALFYPVVTLNVAVNSYSNALLTLLMSNQFVEIKGTVFKKFEKENLFQLTCADVVERFQLWLMLLIIALRNIVEMGGLSISLSSAFDSSGTTNLPTNASTSPNLTTATFFTPAIVPKAFTVLPTWAGDVLGPFLIVLGSEALVDWCKHAYITKFNNIKPDIYGRFLDVLAKDYYSHAFADQNLTKRIGLPVIPLSCLFIRAGMQTYHMFLATHVPLPPPSSATTSISLEAQASGGFSSQSLATAALHHFDAMFRRAMGRSTFGAAPSLSPSSSASQLSWIRSLCWSLDDIIALTTMLIFFLAIYFLLLAFKLLLGISLLSFARRRYKGMKERERQNVDTQGARRVGGFGAVELGEEKRRWIYEDDPEGLLDLREKEMARKNKAEKGTGSEMRLENVDRYSMAAKRIW